MKVGFFQSDADDSTPQQRGHLLEQLARRLLEQLRFRKVVLRSKHSSLEYDIEGEQPIGPRVLYGEAKAHDAKIDGATLAAFVGKILPRAKADQPLHGLLISISPLTAEARDYLDQFPDGRVLPSLTLQVMAGEEIPAFLSTISALIGEDALRSRVRELYGLEMLDSWVVVSDRDNFIAATVGVAAVSGASGYAIFKPDGTALALPDEIARRLTRQLPDFAGLTPVASRVDRALASPRSLPGVAAGQGWFDYKFPASPEYFIGRTAVIETFTRLVSTVGARTTAVRVMQLVSRSGVGKSSLLLKLSTITDQGVVLVIDGRSLRSPGDLRLLVAQLVLAANAAYGTALVAPRTTEEIEPALRSVHDAGSRSGAVAIVGIDQFESIFTAVSVFRAFIELVELVTERGMSILFAIARKNDLAVTYDESAQVDLGRLNDLSTSLRLDDFSPEESEELLRKLPSELGQAVRPQLAESIATFSAGFPWLHKRLCAHVIAMHNAGVSQGELIQTGLQAEDLFEEDLAGLTEQDRALLRTIAAHLPASASDLAERLEGEVSLQRLTSKLNEFLGQRLLRLAGDIYDTYNDVFKTYLLTDRVPFQSRYVFRTPPAATMELLREVVTVGPTDLASFQRHVGGNPIAVLNKLRELRLLSLIESRPGYVALTPEAQTALETDTMAERLRRSLRGNELVTSALDQLAGRGDLTLQDVVDELRRQLPHVAAADSTWRQYADVLARWLHHAGLARVEGDAILPTELPAEDVLEPRSFYLGTFRRDVFLPSVRPRKVVELLERLRGGPVSRSDVYAWFGGHAAPGLLRDAETLELVSHRGEEVMLGRQGRLLVNRGLSIGLTDVAQLALTKPNVRALVAATDEKRISNEEQREILGRFGSAAWEESTWKWRLAVLRAWLVATGLVASRRGGIEGVY